METPLPKKNSITTHRQAREQGHELLRRNVIEAASRLLVQEGPDALTVRRIAQELACSTKVIYTMFQGKDGLADALYQEGCQQLRFALESVETINDASVYLHAVAQVYWTFAFTNPGYYRVMFCGAIPNFKPSETSIQEADSAFEVCMKMAERLIHPRNDSSIVIKMIWAALHGVIHLQFMGHFKTLDLAKDVYERIVQSLIAALEL